MGFYSGKEEVKKLFHATFYSQNKELPKKTDQEKRRDIKELPPLRETSSALEKKQLENATKQIQEREKRICELQQYEWRAKREREQRTTLEKLLHEEQKDHRECKSAKEKLSKAFVEQQVKLVELEKSIELLNLSFAVSQQEVEQLNQRVEDGLEESSKLKEEKLFYEKTALQRTAELAQEKERREEKESELQRLYEQFNRLRTGYGTLEKEKEESFSAYEESKKKIEALSQQELLLSSKVKEEGLRYDFLQKEFEELQLSHSTAIKENKTWEMRCFEALRENSQLATAFSKIGSEKELIEKELAEAKKTIGAIEALQLKQQQEHAAAEQKQTKLIVELEEEQKALISQLTATRENLLIAAQRSEEAHSLLEETEKMLKEAEATSIRLQGELADCLDEKSALEEALQHTALCLEEEKDAGYKAHQHLAKKVKDNALLQEESEQKQKLVESLQEAVLQYEKTIEEKDSLVEQQQLLLQEKEESYQREIKKMEEQQLEQQQQTHRLKKGLEQLSHENRELKKMEANYRQLMAVINSAEFLPKGERAPLSGEESKKNENGQARWEDFSPCSPTNEIAPASITNQDLFQYSPSTPAKKASLFD